MHPAGRGQETTSGALKHRRYERDLRRFHAVRGRRGAWLHVLLEFLRHSTLVQTVAVGMPTSPEHADCRPRTVHPWAAVEGWTRQACPQWSSRTVEDTSARRIPPNPRVNSHRKHPTASGARFASELRSYRAYCGVVVETLFFPRARGQWQVSPPTPHTPRAPRDCIPASCHTPPRPPNLVKRPRRRAPRDSRTPDL